MKLSWMSRTGLTDATASTLRRRLVVDASDQPTCPPRGQRRPGEDPLHVEDRDHGPGREGAEESAERVEQAPYDVGRGQRGGRLAQRRQQRGVGGSVERVGQGGDGGAGVGGPREVEHRDGQCGAGQRRAPDEAHREEHPLAPVTIHHSRDEGRHQHRREHPGHGHHPDRGGAAGAKRQDRQPHRERPLGREGAPEGQLGVPQVRHPPVVLEGCRRLADPPVGHGRLFGLFFTWALTALVNLRS